MLFSSSDGNRTERSVPVFSCGAAVYAIGKYVTKFMVYDILYQFTCMDKKRKVPIIAVGFKVNNQRAVHPLG